MDQMSHALVQSLLFSLVGIGVLGLAFFVMTKLTPFSIRKEIEDDQNTALGIVLGAGMLGIAIIIAAAVH